MLKPGDSAPDFNAEDSQGQRHSLNDFKGKTLVLWFYPKADTPGCTAEACSFRDLKSEYDKKNAAILGVSFDTKEENAAFARKFGFTFPLLCDTDRKLGLAYGAAEQASSPHAKRIAIIIGPDGKVKEYLPKVDAATFPEEALGRL
jgi:peroxiredoxin Q/BCP